jgi:pyrroline-5-carboxylate reductase
MKTKSIGFIGAGRITRIFLQAFKNKKIAFKRIVVFDTLSDTTEKLKQLFPQIEISGIEQCSSQEVVFIALHPPVIMETLEKIAPVVSEKSTVISLAPKIKIEGIAGKLKTTVKIARLIPNATSVINEGYNPVCFSAGMSGQAKSEILELLALLGKTFEVPEHKLEAYAIISAMSPTYFWYQWKTLSEIGVKIGMNEKEAGLTVYNTMIAALDTYFKSGLTPEEVFDLVPVKPMSDYESQINELYHNKLTAVFEKIKP